jgi:hypothetical protein
MGQAHPRRENSVLPPFDAPTIKLVPHWSRRKQLSRAQQTIECRTLLTNECSTSWTNESRAREPWMLRTAGQWELCPANH